LPKKGLIRPSLPTCRKERRESDNPQGPEPAIAVQTRREGKEKGKPGNMGGEGKVKILSH